MSTLKDFLIDDINAIEDIHEITINNRLKDFKFKIKPISRKDFNKYKSECRKVKKKQIIFDDTAFDEKVILKGCVEPNFADTEFIEKAGCKTPGELINKVLKAGEIQDLVNEITILSGFDDDDDMEELVEEAKN